MASIVQIPWYATGLRGDKLAAGLAGIAPIALRYGARSYSLYRFRDDRYKFSQMAEFEHKADFEAYWYGPEFTDFRVLASGWFQVPVVYGWTDLVTAGTLQPEPLAHSAASGPIVTASGGDRSG